MKATRRTVLALTLLGLAACAPGNRSTGTGGDSVNAPATTAPGTTPSGASESWPLDPNVGGGAP